MKDSNRITRLVTVGLIAGALAAPAASARPVSDPPIQNGGEPVVIEPDPRPSCRASTRASTGRPPRSAPAPPAGWCCSSASAAPATAIATTTSASRARRNPLATQTDSVS